MADFSIYQYLDDDTLAAMVRDLARARAKVRWCADHATSTQERSLLNAECQAVYHLWTAATTERTARLALTPERRAQLKRAATE